MTKTITLVYEVGHISGTVIEVGFYAGREWIDLTNYKRNCHIADETLAETIQKILSEPTKKG